MSKTLEEQIAELKKAIATLENQRATLGDVVVDASISALKKQLDELESQFQPPEQKRKLVTVFFTDIVGSTELVRDLDPEDNMEIVEGALQQLAAPIEEHGGHITRFTGDGFKAVFGIPLAHENDPEMAIRAGLEMLEAARSYASELEAKWKIRGFSVRVGIDTGLVVTGGYSEAEDTVKGMPVNLATRLQSAAPPGGLLISHNTYQHVRGVFDVDPLEPILAKGFNEPVRTYLVKSARPRTFRVQTRGVVGVETQMIGREAELKHLQEALYTVLEDGECQMVSVVAEAGVGKSRLLYEFQNWLEFRSETCQLFMGRSSQEMQNSPYALLRDMFSAHFRIQDSDPARVVYQKVEEGIGEALGVDAEGKSRAHFIGQLVGFDFSASPLLQGVLDDARQLRDRARIYLSEYFQATTERSPTVVFLEDIHWADDNSLDMVHNLVARTTKQRLLIICLARPSLFERRPFWGEGQAFHTRLSLQPLSKRESRRLVGEILKKADQIPLLLRELVVSGAEGNPFYIEELIKMLIEEGVIVKGEEQWQVQPVRLSEMQVPPTLKGILQARLDSLPPVEHAVLQQASVAGRRFWDNVVKRISATTNGGSEPEEIDYALSELRDKEMIFRREDSAFTGAVEYVFKHALLRDVTYESVLKRVRGEYHALVAGWLIEQSGERGGEFTGIIADHLELAGQKERAVTYLRQAGEQAARQYANGEALKYLSRALDLAPVSDAVERFAILSARVKVYSLMGERQNQEEDLTALAQLVETLDDERKRGEFALLQAFHARETSNYPVIISAAQEAIRIGQGIKVVHLEANGLLLWGRALLSQGDYVGAREKFASALSLAEEAGYQNFEAESLRNLGIVEETISDPAQAIDYYERSLALYRRIGDRRGEGKALNNLGNSLFKQGDRAKGSEYYQQVLSIWREIGDRWGEGIVVSNIADAHLSQSNYSDARDYFEQALQITRQIGNQTIEISALVGLGTVLLEQSNFAKATTLFELSLNIARNIGNRPMEGRTLSLIGRLFHRQGDYVRARSYYDQSLHLYRELGIRQGESRLLTYFGLLSHHLGDHDEAREFSRGALEIARSLDHRENQGLALIQLGHASHGLGLDQESVESYSQAQHILGEIAQPNLAMEALAGLARVNLSKGDLAHAQAQVATILDYLQERSTSVGETSQDSGGGSVPGLEGAAEPLRVCLTCFQVLEANQDPQAQGILATAYTFLQEQAAKIEDVELRNSFLRNVPENQEIQQAFAGEMTP